MPVRTRRRIVAALLAAALLLALALSPSPAPSPVPVPDHSPGPASAPARLDAAPPAPAPAPADAPVAPRPHLAPFLEEPRDWGEVVVDVVDEQGLAVESALVVVDCGAIVRMTRPGGALYVRVGSCTVRAFRRDGVFHTLSEPETVEVGPDDPAYVLLELPSARKGGVGLRFMPEEGGMRVMEVVPGSPADEAGLAAGDVVLDVGGHPTADMNPETFVGLMTGAEGSDVTFTVGWSGDTGLVEETVTVARRFLEG